MNQIEIVITNYDTITREYDHEKNSSWMYHIEWDRIFTDEAHMARNPKTKKFESLSKLKTKNFWCVTGTPIVNYSEDVVSLSRLCTPDDVLDLKYQNKSCQWKDKYVLRRTKAELNLPGIRVEEVWLEFDESERKLYSEIEGITFETIQKEFAIGNDVKSEKSVNSVLEKLIKLRQICVDPLIMSGGEKTRDLLRYTNTLKKRKIEFIEEDMESIDPNEIIEVVSENYNQNVEQTYIDYLLHHGNVQQSTKIKAIMEMVKDILSKNPEEKIVIFTQFVTMMNVVEYHLQKQNIFPLRLDGNIASNLRNDIVKKFTADKSQNIIIVSLKTGGVGVTLVPARYLIMIDIWWSPAVDQQAIDRIHRIGTIFLYVLSYIVCLILCIRTISRGLYLSVVIP
jgi:SNF2 family DNA or RNA helicase